MISITVSSPEELYIEFTCMPSPIYQYVTNLVASLPVSRGPGLLLNVSVRNIVFLKTRIFDVANFTILTPLSLLT
jgi:hypothetical protein